MGVRNFCKTEFARKAIIIVWCSRIQLFMMSVKNSSPGLKVIKMFMLNSADHEIYRAHKC